MINPSHIEAVIFDCDGVLIDSEILSATMLREEAREWGVEITIPYILKNYVGRSFPSVLADIQAKFNIQLADGFEAQYRQRLLSAFEAELQPMDGIQSVLSALNRPFCVATSSSPERAARSLAITGLSQFFGEKIYTASLVKNGKPAPDVFLYAAQKMQVNPEQCLVIEDSETGVKAGLSAKMMTARFMGGKHLYGFADESNADLTFDKFEKFFEYFPSLRKNL